MLDIGKISCLNFEDSKKSVQNEMRVLESTTERIWMGINKGWMGIWAKCVREDERMRNEKIPEVLPQMHHHPPSPPTPFSSSSFFTLSNRESENIGEIKIR